MRITKILLLASLSAVGLASSGLAQTKQVPTKSGPVVQSGSNIASGAVVLLDAIRLCDLVVTNDRAILDVLDLEGWTQEVDYNIGNAPFYKEISGGQFYEGVGNADLWGFLEEYIGNTIGYCSITIADPEITFDLLPINDLDHIVGEIEHEGESVFGTWRDISDHPSVFIHAYQNSDTFTYQITRVNKAD